MAGDFDSDCVMTLAEVKGALAKVEVQLAQRADVLGPGARRDLLALDRKGLLGDDELVSRWHELLAIYLDWARSEVVCVCGLTLLVPVESPGHCFRCAKPN